MQPVSIDDLSPLVHQVLEALYARESARRTRCSREDFAAGFLALAAHLRIAAYLRADGDSVPHSSTEARG